MCPSQSRSNLGQRSLKSKKTHNLTFWTSHLTLKKIFDISKLYVTRLPSNGSFENKYASNVIYYFSRSNAFLKNVKYEFLGFLMTLTLQFDLDHSQNSTKWMHIVIILAHTVILSYRWAKSVDFDLKLISGHKGPPCYRKRSSGEKVTGGTLMLRNELEIEVHRFGPSIAQNDRMDENNKNMHLFCWILSMVKVKLQGQGH